MSGSEIVQIVSLVLTALVSIITLLVRARIIALEGEIKDLGIVITAQNQLILAQGQTIDKLSSHLVTVADEPKRKVKEEPYTTMPLFRKG